MKEMGKAMRWFLKAMYFCAAGYLSTGASTALGAAPSTRPASRPAYIDQVVEVPKFTLATKGKHPKEAFEMLSKASGYEVTTSLQFDSSGQGRRVEFWDNEYREVDFDLNGVCFLEALNRLANHSRLYSDVGKNVIELRLKDTATVGGVEVLKPLAQATVREKRPVCYSGGVYCRSYLQKDELSFYFEADPVMRICGKGEPVLEEVVNERGEKISWKWDSSRHCYQLDDRKTPTLKQVKGYIPVTVVTKSKEVEIPLKTGVKAEGGGWEIEVVYFGDFTMASNDLSRNLRVYLGMEWKGEGGRPDLTDISSFFRMNNVRDGRREESTYGDAELRPTVSGGVRRSFRYLWFGFDPETAVISLPLEIKEAAIGFEFSDVKAEK